MSDDITSGVMETEYKNSEMSTNGVDVLADGLVVLETLTGYTV